MTDPLQQSAPRTEIEIEPKLSPAAREILRGVQRTLKAHGFESLAEVVLANGRRADVMALGPGGDCWIVEIKSSIADFRSDSKWPEYRDYCDRLFFAVAPDFPNEILPPDTGLILADRYDGEIVRVAPEARLAPARRKAVTLAFARVAAARLMHATEPPIPAKTQSA
ncbi:MAG TPA: MmcB family DNA repair protein [Hyphomicrobium sp.]|nr:MmcB family DNA repair protein [Hyphomicrobium sp.]